MSQEIISKIDNIIGRINTHPEYYMCLARDQYHFLREESEKHSLDMELEGDSEILISKAGDIVRARDRHKSDATKRLSEARNFLAKDGISVSTLSFLGYRIAPKRNKFKNFRNKEFLYGPFSGIEPGKIIYKMDDLINFLKDPLFHPILKASNAHLEMVLIHPYVDGNGRASRIVQNQLLQERGYPSAVIHSNEKENYFKFIGNALKDRIDFKSTIYNQSNNEELFHEFVASKVLESVESVEDLLKSERMYKVNLSNISNFGIVRNLSSALRSMKKNGTGKGIKVSIDKRKGGKKGTILSIIGDVSQEELKVSLQRFADRSNFKFEIDSNPQKDC